MAPQNSGKMEDSTIWLDHLLLFSNTVTGSLHWSNLTFCRAWENSHQWNQAKGFSCKYQQNRSQVYALGCHGHSGRALGRADHWHLTIHLGVPASLPPPATYPHTRTPTHSPHIHTQACGWWTRHQEAHDQLLVPEISGRRVTSHSPGDPCAKTPRRASSSSAFWWMGPLTAPKSQSPFSIFSQGLHVCNPHPLLLARRVCCFAQ